LVTVALPAKVVPWVTAFPPETSVRDFGLSAAAVGTIGEV
jgi:hypothetical protein